MNYTNVHCTLCAMSPWCIMTYLVIRWFSSLLKPSLIKYGSVWKGETNAKKILNTDRHFMDHVTIPLLKESKWRCLSPLKLSVKAEWDGSQWPLADCLHQDWWTIAGHDPILPPSDAHETDNSLAEWKHSQ